MRSLTNQLSDSKSIKNDIEELKQLKSTIELLPKRMDKTEEEIYELNGDMNDLRSENEILRDRIAALEQYSRVNNMIISNVPLG